MLIHLRQDCYMNPIASAVNDDSYTRQINRNHDFNNYNFLLLIRQSIYFN
jgi:hypothetical protein